MKRFLMTLVGVALIFGVVWFVKYGKAPSLLATPTPDEAYDRSVSDGTITVSFPAKEFGLATTPTQILVRSYIPPCNPNFNYCLYFIGQEYKGTNFDSAGLRLKNPDDLTTEQVC